MIEPSEDPSWLQYADAVLEIGIEPVVRFRVREGPTPLDLEQLAAAGIPRSWAVVTPCNPRGTVVSAAENSSRVLSAARDLEQEGVPRWAATGGSHDGSHAEPGFLLAIGRESARELSVRWGQSAFFFGDGRDVWLCAALVRSDDTRLTQLADDPKS